MNPYITFGEIKIGKLFNMNGNSYIKQSSRTAKMLSNGRTFYIGQKDLVYKIAQP